MLKFDSLGPEKARAIMIGKFVEFSTDPFQIINLLAHPAFRPR